MKVKEQHELLFDVDIVCRAADFPAKLRFKAVERTVRPSLQLHG